MVVRHTSLLYLFAPITHAVLNQLLPIYSNGHRKANCGGNRKQAAAQTECQAMRKNAAQKPVASQTRPQPGKIEPGRHLATELHRGRKRKPKIA